MRWRDRRSRQGRSRMDKSKGTMAQRVAQAASAFEQQRTGHMSPAGAAQMHGQLPGGSGPGSYRAVAPATRFGNQSCQETDRTFQQP